MEKMAFESFQATNVLCIGLNCAWLVNVHNDGFILCGELTMVSDIAVAFNHSQSSCISAGSKSQSGGTINAKRVDMGREANLVLSRSIILTAGVTC